VALRVHFVSENIGGHATMHMHLAAALAEHPEIEPSFFQVPPAGALRKVVRAPVPGIARLDLDFHPLRDQLAGAVIVRRELKRGPDARRADVLHMYTQNAGLLSVDILAARASVVSTDATNRLNAYRLPQRTPARFTPLAASLTAKIEGRVYAAATLLIANSEWVARSMVDEYGIPRERIRFIPFGITEPARPPGITPSVPPRIMFVGTSLQRKGGQRLLNVWREQLRDRAELVLVTHEEVPPEPGLIVRNDVQQGDGKVERLLAQASVFAFPSEVDSFGYAVIEAMAMGVPVVAVRTAGVQEVVADAETGILVEGGDDRELVSALRSLLDDEWMRERMGQAGYVRFRSRFDARVTTAQLIDVLSEADGIGPRRRRSSSPQDV
jgi:glycosyltransferase involved in cell wall biosynthesis